MKNVFHLIIFLCLMYLKSAGQVIEKAPTDKAVVYFVRPSSFGFAINFSYYDSTIFIGKFNGPKYMRYECNPGKHLFWARSENRYFVEADLLAGKIYFLEAIPIMGAMKAGVELNPIDPMDIKKKNKVMKLLKRKPSESFSNVELEKEALNQQDNILKAMKIYKTDKANGVNMIQLNKTQYHDDLNIN